MIKVDRGIQPPVLAKRAAAGAPTWRRMSIRPTVADCSMAIGTLKKEALGARFSWKVRLLRSKISHVSYGHMSTIARRGLRGQPDLAFDWNNLFLACGRCNGPEHKGDRFPTTLREGPSNPCDDEPAEHLHFEFDPVAKIASVFGTTTRGKNDRGASRFEPV